MQARRMMITLRLGVHIGGERLADTLSSCPGRDGTARPCEDSGPYFVDITCAQKSLDRRNIGCPSSHVPIRMDDGIVFRADFYRPPQEGRYSVILLLYHP
jgi:predicted acyl esterase